ncbi:MAG: AAA family ATPase [Gammaproteobacteria bacterium]|nr:AAA family ATPase [Gammaproteobacteria bacterium]
MLEKNDITLLLRAGAPVLILETHEERRAVTLLKTISMDLGLPIFTWSVTSGMRREDLMLDPQPHLKEPGQVLAHIRSSTFDGVYVLLDFHPYLKDPLHVRLLKELAMDFDQGQSKIVLISHEIEAPAELERLSTSFELALPSDADLRDIIREEAVHYTNRNQGVPVRCDDATLEQLLRSVRGLPAGDARRLVTAAIVDDGAITECDMPEIMEAKHRLLNLDDVLGFELETSSFADLAGMKQLKQWLMQREKFFHGSVDLPGMEPPRGILLLGVQGCGKSVAAKAVAGVWRVPLLRLDFGRLYNKYYGETEKNVRSALRTAEVMAPCVLWIDELEKGIAVGDNDDGTSQRLLGTLLTWMAENRAAVFIVATSNNIEQLPPELVRKGRLDEIFFVDLPTAEIRAEIFSIHLGKRGLDATGFDLPRLAALSDGFSGAEIEQLVVSAIYATHSRSAGVTSEDLQHEIEKTRPLSVVMAERVAALRHWASERTVPVD